MTGAGVSGAFRALAGRGRGPTWRRDGSCHRPAIAQYFQHQPHSSVDAGTGASLTSLCRTNPPSRFATLFKPHASGQASPAQLLQAPAGVRPIPEVEAGRLGAGPPLAGPLAPTLSGIWSGWFPRQACRWLQAKRALARGVSACDTLLSATNFRGLCVLLRGKMAV